jgi:hypothetical protein
MKSLEKLLKLADKFEGKIKKFAQQNAAPQFGESNQAPVVQDAFFGPPATGKGQEAFLKYINNPASNFQKSVTSAQGAIGIQVHVDAPSKKANFVVSVNPPALTKQVVDALRKDYAAFYKELPEQQLQRRLSAGEIRPPSVSGVAPFTTM